MLKPSSDHWDVTSYDTPKAYLPSSRDIRCSLPIKYLRMPWNHGSKTLHFDYKFDDLKKRSGKYSVMDIHMWLLKEYTHFFDNNGVPALVDDNWKEFDINYNRETVDGVVFAFDHGSRRFTDGIVRIDSDHLYAHGRYSMAEYPQGSNRYKSGLRKVNGLFREAAGLVKSVSGIPAEGLEALALLNKKFEEEADYRLNLRGEQNVR